MRCYYADLVLRRFVVFTPSLASFGSGVLVKSITLVPWTPEFALLLPNCAAPVSETEGSDL